jgi:hypothetical protein
MIETGLLLAVLLVMRLSNSRLAGQLTARRVQALAP